MSITLDLTPEIEQGLLVQAQAKGVSLKEFVHQIVSLQANAAVKSAPAHQSGQVLVDAFAEIRGLLSDQEIDAMLDRSASTGRPIDL